MYMRGCSVCCCALCALGFHLGEHNSWHKVEHARLLAYLLDLLIGIGVIAATLTTLINSFTVVAVHKLRARRPRASDRACPLVEEIRWPSGRGHDRACGPVPHNRGAGRCSRNRRSTRRRFAGTCLRRSHSTLHPHERGARHHEQGHCDAFTC